MDKLKDRQEERVVDEKISGDKQETGGDIEVATGSTEAVNSEETDVKTSWKHDQEINFSGARKSLEFLASTLQKTISLEKDRLSHMMGIINSYKK